jgi:hypothetical protein
MKKLLANSMTAALLLSSLAPLPARAETSPSLQALQQRLTQAGTTGSSSLNVLFDNNQGSSNDVSAVPTFRIQTLPSGKPMTQDQLKQAMLQNLDFIDSAFAAQYGPGQWKESHEGWDLDTQIAKAKQQVQTTPNITLNQYHEILRNFFYSMKDFHVSVGFDSTESSSLPFTVAGVNGRYYITSINRAKLSETAFPFNVGDELVSFGGQKAADVVKALQARLGNNTQLTDQALAAMFLTSRSGASFGDVAKGPVSVTVKPQGSDKPQSRQLTWDYTPEQIRQPKTQNTFSTMAATDSSGSKLPIPWMNDALSPVQAELAGADAAANPFGLGNRESFLPALGKPVWQSDDDANFNAYIYKLPNGKSIGYVRIPSYEAEDTVGAVKEFGGLMADFQGKTDGLVIDQVDNPGGSVLYLYALASMLSDQPLTTPQHHVAITQDDVTQAVSFLKTEPLVKSDSDAQKVMGPNLDGYPVTYEVYRNMVDYSRFIIDQWNQGKTLTDPIFIEGVDQINPSITANYTKPILLLINELDFSGGDFFPAIMQDNKRATLFGTRTAGAGGFIREVKYPNQVGIDHFVMTGSIAVRADKQPIENLGVHAEIQYAPTASDLKDGFKEYAAAVNAAITRLTGGAGTSPAAK